LLGGRARKHSLPQSRRETRCSPWRYQEPDSRHDLRSVTSVRARGAAEAQRAEASGLDARRPTRSSSRRGPPARPRPSGITLFLVTPRPVAEDRLAGARRRPARRRRHLERRADAPRGRQGRPGGDVLEARSSAATAGLCAETSARWNAVPPDDARLLEDAEAVRVLIGTFRPQAPRRQGYIETELARSAVVGLPRARRAGADASGWYPRQGARSDAFLLAANEACRCMAASADRRARRRLLPEARPRRRDDVRRRA